MPVSLSSHPPVSCSSSSYANSIYHQASCVWHFHHTGAGTLPHPSLTSNPCPISLPRLPGLYIAFSWKCLPVVPVTKRRDLAYVQKPLRTGSAPGPSSASTSQWRWLVFCMSLLKLGLGRSGRDSKPLLSLFYRQSMLAMRTATICTASTGPRSVST